MHVAQPGRKLLVLLFLECNLTPIGPSNACGAAGCRLPALPTAPYYSAHKLATAKAVHLSSCASLSSYELACFRPIARTVLSRCACGVAAAVLLACLRLPHCPSCPAQQSSLLKAAFCFAHSLLDA